ncbi:MAG: hypothetical protein UT55_C0037G0003 [Candidatus Peregrinibacteria bacterium GW2011_GWE2_39_6]|nr:MAG: hypothetical protein UT36_C0003G0050 [Candidatus Peregrinibacteria bacterium GW2011_GWF2_39_17]KKR25584.1 MAG: hypothetical protein UT55_C0037G0003 [Candidatus Peregrinibacteria bacterium GW2011_GWE2_39_6]HCW31987.1 hypothetical protein [Candidatus Peregrinibacteria bacterium]
MLLKKFEVNLYTLKALPKRMIHMSFEGMPGNIEKSESAPKETAKQLQELMAKVETSRPVIKISEVKGFSKSARLDKYQFEPDMPQVLKNLGLPDTNVKVTIVFEKNKLSENVVVTVVAENLDDTKLPTLSNSVIISGVGNEIQAWNYLVTNFKNLDKNAKSA